MQAVRIDLPPVRPNGLTGPCSRALIGGAQLYMVGGPTSHCAIYRGGGRPALGTRFTLSRHSPPIFPDPDLRGAQPVTGSRHRLHCATTSLHRLLSLLRTSLPERRWRPRTRSCPALRRLRFLMVCNLSPLSLCDPEHLLLLC
jgi:hypothetical protein